MIFLYVLSFLWAFVPGWADHCNCLKKAILQEVSEIRANDQKQTTWKTVEFWWTLKQQASFKYIKRSLLKNILTDDDDKIQYHLITDVSKTGVGRVLFQLFSTMTGKWVNNKIQEQERIVMFLFFQFLSAETRYHIMKREALTVLKCLEKVWWLIKRSVYSIKLYTDHQTLLKVLKRDNEHGRLVWWQLWLKKYKLDIKHVSEKDLVIADDLSQIWKSSFYVDLINDNEFTLSAFTVEEKLFTKREECSDKQWKKDWVNWIEDSWYINVVKYLVTSDLRREDTLVEINLRIVQKKAKKFKLVNEEIRRLSYKKRSEKLSLCLQQYEV